MMEAARTSEALVNFYQTTLRNNPEDSHLHSFVFTQPFKSQLTADRQKLFQVFKTLLP
jgi:hypothetical protein